jgi:hypothetical protein
MLANQLFVSVTLFSGPGWLNVAGAFPFAVSAIFGLIFLYYITPL